MQTLTIAAVIYDNLIIKSDLKEGEAVSIIVDLFYLWDKSPSIKNEYQILIDGYKEGDSGYNFDLKVSIESKARMVLHTRKEVTSATEVNRIIKKYTINS